MTPKHSTSQRLSRPAPVSRLTRRQRNVFDFICSFRLEHGSSPSHAEIAAHLGVKSLTPVLRAVVALDAAGAIARRRGKRRSIVPVSRSAVTLELPDVLERAVRIIATRARTTPEAVVAEAVHERLSGICEALEETASRPRR